jgi:hypothetical protein
MRLLILSALGLIIGSAASAALAGNPHCGYVAKSYAAPYKAPVYQAPYVAPAYVPPTVVVVPVPYAYEKPVALQGHTYFSYSKAAEPYIPLDAALYFDKGVRLQEQTLSVIQAGREAFESSLQAKVQADKEVAEAHIAANGMAAFAKEFFAGQARLKELSLLKSEGSGVLRLTAPSTATAVLKTSCVKCHEKYGDWESLDYETQRKIFSRVNHPDPEKRMPRAGDGKEEGEPLSDDAKLLLFPVK